MTTTTIDHPIGPDDVREDGSPWPFALLKGDETILADDAGEIISYLVEGYGDLPDDPSGHDEALVMRAATAVMIASTVQAMVASDGVSDGHLVIDEATEDVLSAIFADRTLPVVGIDRWDHPVPLVLVATDYAPYAEDSPPSGNVLWIEPQDETSYLKSLAALGVISLYVHEEH